MKQYFDVYIRATKGPIDFSDLQGNDNVLDDWDRLEYPEAKASFKVSPQIGELGDGTQGVDGEKVEIESGTLRVDSTEYAWLREQYDNKLCDVLFYNSSTRTVVAVAYGVKVNVTHMITSGESRVIKIVGARSIGVDAWESGTVDLLVDLVDQKAVFITGTVYDTDGVTPVEGANVKAALEDTFYRDSTDKDGNYLILIHNYVNDLELTVTKDGWDWESVSPVVDVNAENVVNFVARAV